MDSRLRDAIAPSYLFLCLLLGGSAQGIWANMTLQLVGLAILACDHSVARLGGHFDHLIAHDRTSTT